MATPSPGAKIIVLHGPSSSGKSTLARALQAALPEPFWHISIDHLRDAGVLPTARIASGEFPWGQLRANFFAGFHLSLAAYAAAGNNLIVEHIFDTDGWLAEVATRLAPYDVYFVGLHCSLDELARREAARGDRPTGSAARDHGHVHRNMTYDLELDGEHPVNDNVARLMAAWEQRHPPSALTRAATATP